MSVGSEKQLKKLSGKLEIREKLKVLYSMGRIEISTRQLMSVDSVKKVFKFGKCGQNEICGGR